MDADMENKIDSVEPSTANNPKENNDKKYILLATPVPYTRYC